MSATGPRETAYVERCFLAIAGALDELDEEQGPIFLAKLALVLADHVGDFDVVEDAIARAKRDLDRR